MVGFIVVLLVIWLLVALLGFVLKGLFWLAVIAVAVIVATGAIGWARRNSLKK